MGRAGRVDPPPVRGLPAAGSGRPVRRPRLVHAPGRAGVLAGRARDPAQPAWEEQRRAVFERGRPASSGGRSRPSRAAAATSPGPGPRRPRSTRRAPARAASTRVTGDKHFGSGSGVTDRMMTTAVPEGEEPARRSSCSTSRDRPWDGRAGLRLIAEWDGMGMAATQSHAMRLEAIPAVRLAWAGPLRPGRRGRPPVRLRAVHRRRPRRARRGRRHGPPPDRARRPDSCGPSSRSSGRAPRWSTGWPSRPTRARCGPSSGGDAAAALHAALPGQAVGGRPRRDGPVAHHPGPRRRHVLPAARRSPAGSRTCGRSASSVRRGAWPSTTSSPRRSRRRRPDAAGVRRLPVSRRGRRGGSRGRRRRPRAPT